jgi:hypothetical protein
MLRCCHCWTRPLVLIVLLFSPHLLSRDLQHLDAFRGICTTDDFAAELVFIKTYNKYDLPRWRKILQIWPSTRKLSGFSKLLG